MFLDLTNLAVITDLTTACIWLAIVGIPGIFAGIYEVARYKKAKKVAHLESLNEESDSAFQDGPQKSVEEFVLDGNKTNTQILKQEIEGKSSTTIKEIKRDRVKDGNGME